MAKTFTGMRLSAEVIELIEKIKALEKYDERSSAYIVEQAVKLLAAKEGVTLPNAPQKGKKGG